MDHDFNAPVDSLDKVPEQFRPLYEAGDDGKYVVGETFKGVSTALVGLNTSLKAARLESKNKTPVDLSALSDFGSTPEEIKTAFETKVAELTEEAAKGGKVNVDKIRADLAAEFSTKIKKSDTRAEALQGQLYSLLVENAAVTAVAEAKGTPELLMPFVKQQVKVVEEDGNFVVYVVDQSGDRRYSGVTGQPMTIKELVNEMKANERYGRLFDSDMPDGSGTPPGSGRKAAPRPTGKELTSVEKIGAGLKNRAKR